MRNALLSGLCLLLLGLSPTVMPEPERLERELVAAIGKTDLATYERIVADDYVVVDATGKEITKAEVIASYKDGTRKYTNLEIFDVKSRVFGDTAIVTARTKGMRRENGQDIVNDVRYMRVYARRGGTWRAVSQMSTPAK